MPVLKYYDGSAWVALPSIRQRGPRGTAGATGPIGATGPAAETSHLLLKAGDTATELNLSADPIAPLDAAPKQYVDALGTPNSSIWGTIVSTSVASGGALTEVTPVPAEGSGLTVSGTDVILNRAGYYLVYFISQWDVPIPAGTRSFINIAHNAINSARSSLGPGEEFGVVNDLIWAAAGDSVRFGVSQSSGATRTCLPVPINFAVRFLGENH